MLSIPPKFSCSQDGDPCPIVAGTKLIYDQKNGTMSFLDPDGNMLFFQVPGKEVMVNRDFLGKDFSKYQIRALIVLIAGSYGLKGEVIPVEGSLPSLQTYEIRG